MRLFNASASELQDFGLPKEEFDQYSTVRFALIEADKPASKRPVGDGGAQLPACLFDPILQETIDACNKH